MQRYILAAAAAALLLAAAGASVAQTMPASGDHPDQTTLALTVTGQTKITPDEATITLGVQTSAPTAQDAMRENAARMTAVVGALHAAGIVDKDIQTSNLSLAAQYDYPQNQPARLTGYQATNEVAITVEDIGKLGGVIDAVTTAGANQVNSISFGLRDPTTAENQARLDAVRQLKARADLYAQATGYHIVRLLNLVEGGSARVQPVPVMAMARMQAPQAQTPVQSGELTVEVMVSASYRMAP
jgi:uncharacterized protein YggE